MKLYSSARCHAVAFLQIPITASRAPEVTAKIFVTFLLPFIQKTATYGDCERSTAWPGTPVRPREAESPVLISLCETAYGHAIKSI